jgi:O-methyltransferase
MDSKALYLELLKRTLSYALWPEPPVPVEAYQSRRDHASRLAVGALATVARWANKQLVQTPTYSEEERRDGRVWPGHADTMVGLKRLDNVQACVESVVREGVEGDLIETGVWRGGVCILMRAVLAAYGDTVRSVYVADSFQGLPPPDPDRYPADAGDELHRHRILAVSLDQVRANFERYGLLDRQVVFLPGWFEQTLPHAPMERLAVMRLDGDMYGSTIVALESLYPKLAAGGYCIIDDYALPGCRRAVEDFRARHGVVEPIESVDWSGVFWRKQR